MPADFLCPKGGGAIYFRIERIAAFALEILPYFCKLISCGHLLSARKPKGNRRNFALKTTLFRGG
jgi:hypothetical protein